MKKSDRKKIFDKYGGRCAYCGRELTDKFHIDHIEPIVRNIKSSGCMRPENDRIENMNPACASCNIQKNSHTIEQFRHNIAHFVTSLNRDSTQYKFAKRYGLVTETHNPVKFYFETLWKH